MESMFDTAAKAPVCSSPSADAALRGSPPNRQISAKLRVFSDWVADLFARHGLAHSRSVPVIVTRTSAETSPAVLSSSQVQLRDSSDVY